MEHFFDTAETIGEGSGFKLFSPLHLGWLGVFAAVAVIFSLLYRRGDEKHRAAMRYTVAGLLVADEIFKHAMLVIGGNWLPDYLPLHLCSINILLITIHAFKPSKLLDNFLYCVCLPAALAALLFPSWSSLPLMNFMHLHSTTVHILLALYPLMLLAGGDIRPDPKYIPRCLLLVCALAAPIAVVNKLLGTNFMFLCFAPAGTPLVWFENALGEHLIGFPVLFAAVLFVMYFPVWLRERAKLKRVRSL